MTLRELRQAAGWSLEKAAVMAGVSSATARLYEADPSSITRRAKRAGLDRVYADLRVLAQAPETDARST